MDKSLNSKTVPESLVASVSSSYDWLKESKTCWTAGSVGFPVEVEIISLDFENKIAELKTQYQKGSLSFSELYKSEMSCPCR